MSAHGQRGHAFGASSLASSVPGELARPWVPIAVLIGAFTLGLPVRPLAARSAVARGESARGASDEASPNAETRDARARRTIDDELCPGGTIPDGDVCVRLRNPDQGSDAQAIGMTHRERSGRLAAYEQIPRRPERPADYDAYVYPVPAAGPGGHAVISGYDLDRPDDEQRRGRTLRATGHGGVDLPQARGTPVSLISLDGQKGDATIIYAGPLFGTTCITRHTVTEAGRVREYIVLYGHLERVASGIAAGVTAPVGTTLGYVGDTGSPELVHLHFEARRVRDGVDVTKIEPGRLVASEVSIVCDPRNVLPLR